MGLVFQAVGVATASEKTKVFVPATHEQGKLVEVSGVPVLHLSGSPFAMGEQHGVLLRDQIRRLYSDYLVPFMGGPEIANGAAYMAQSTMWSHVPERYRREMEGLAKGSGFTVQQIFLMQSFLDLKKMVACSTFGVLPSRSETGEPMLARNLDFPSLGMAQKYSLVIVRHPEKGVATATIGWPGLLGTLSGLSEKGVAMAMMEVETRRSSLHGMPYQLLYRWALENAKDVDGYIAQIQKAKRTASNNIMVMDASGGAAVLELTAAKVAVRRANKDIILATNHFESSSLKQDVQCSRFKTLSREAKRHSGAWTSKQLERLLDKVDLAEMNLQAMIFFPRTRSIHLSVGRIPAASGPYQKLGKSDLFP
ncbi:MAG: hypothetical protein CMH54_09350 [Myxococcales bacterium]|nr:hypothetical protein [Myxococcales bacterium]